jgi:hypothetical protein
VTAAPDAVDPAQTHPAQRGPPSRGHAGEDQEVPGCAGGKVHRKLDNGAWRPRAADRHIKQPDSKYSSKLSYRINTRHKLPTQRVPPKAITLQPQKFSKSNNGIDLRPPRAA